MLFKPCILILIPSKSYISFLAPHYTFFLMYSFSKKFCCAFYFFKNILHILLLVLRGYFSFLACFQLTKISLCFCIFFEHLILKYKPLPQKIFIFEKYSRTYFIKISILNPIIKNFIWKITC